MSACHSNDGRILAPWVMKDVEQLWNTYFSKPFNWRSFTLGKAGSSKKAAYRLSMTLRKNARWIDCSADTDIDQLYEQWRSYMLGASAYLTKHGTEEAAAALDRPLEITMTFWRFLEPSLKHLHDMPHLCMGNDPDGALAADEQRRKDKASIDPQGFQGRGDELHQRSGVPVRQRQDVKSEAGAGSDHCPSGNGSGPRGSAME